MTINQATSDFHALFMAALDAMVVADEEGRFVELNPAACDLFGLPLEKLAGTRIADYMAPGFDFTAAWNRFLSEGRQEGEVRIRHSSGEFRDVEFRAISHAVEGRHLSIMRDVTAKKKTEQLATQKTKELERSNFELEQFSQVASHDLQEPLNKITAFLELIDRHRAMDDKEKDYFKRIQSATARMKSLIKDLLEYARLAATPQAVESVDLNQLFGLIVADLEYAGAGGKAELTVNPLPKTWGNKMQLRQLFQNLLVNAVKFAKKGSPARVEIRGRTVDPAWIEVEVQDSGIGFEEKYLEKIFMPFERLHGRSAYQGSGLGLAICRRIAYLHGGSITARAKPGEGAVFIVTLPSSRE